MFGRLLIGSVLLLLLAVAGWMFLPVLLPWQDLTIKPPRNTEPMPVQQAPISFVSIPLQISLRQLEAELNAKLAEALAKKNEGGQGKKVKVKIKQTGAATLQGKGSVLALRIPVSFKTSGRFKTNGKLNIIGDISLDVSEDWTPLVDIQPHMKWTKKPRIKFGPFKIRVAGPVGDKIQDALDDAAKDLHKKLSRSLDLKAKADEGWQKLYQVRQIKNKPPVWLVVEPQAFYMAPIGMDANWIKLAFGLAVRLSTAVGHQPDPVSPKPLPSMTHGLPPERGLMIRLPVMLDYTALVSQLKAKLIGKRIRVDRGAITPTDLDIYTSGQNLAVAVTFQGDAAGLLLDTHGTVYFTGIPTLDVKTNVLSVREFNYTRQVNNPLVHTATWVMRESLRSKLEKHLAWDLNDTIDKAKADATKFLNRPLEKGLLMSGECTALQISGLHLQTEGIIVDLEAQGHVAISGVPAHSLLDTDRQ